MGKEEKPVVLQEEQQVENIEASIDKQNVLTEEAAKQAAENIAKKNKDRKVAEMENLLQRSDYTRNKQLLILRRQRKNANAAKDFLKEISALDDELKTGKLDKFAWEVKYREAYEKRAKAFKEADAAYSQYCEKLRNAFPNSWSYEWDYTLDVR